MNDQMTPDIKNPRLTFRDGGGLAYLRLSKWQRFLYKIVRFFVMIPFFFKNLGIKIYQGCKKLVFKVRDEFVDVFNTFRYGDWKTRISFVIMGFGCFARKQILKGLLFFVFELVFIFYMIFAGANWLSQIGTLGIQGREEIWNEEYGITTYVYHDNSFKILLYSVLTIFFIVAFIYTWRANIKQNRIAQQILASGKQLRSNKDDVHSMIDDQFHKTLLALPTLGILVFTVMPIVFMVLIAFTNYDGSHDGLNKLFTWVGWENFNTMFSWKSGSNAYSAAFGEILSWTLIWAFFATFSNYFLGMFVAIMINKKGIKLKKLWRTVLVLTIAIPQFISLLYVSKLFSDTGIILTFMRKYLGVSNSFSFIGTNANKWVARFTIIIINIWIGIPYLMLIATGILMNIPEDLYESAKIDGANAASGASGSVGYTDLLITWLFKITMGANSEYKMASVIGILVFIVSAGISLLVYNIMPSTRNEEDFQ